MVEVLFWGEDMVALRESEIGIRSADKESSINEKTSENLPLRPPESHIILVFKNGTGNIVKERTTIDSWRDSTLREKINREIERLKERQERIPGQLQGLSQRKRKHGGKRSPKRELREIRERLIKEQEGIPDRIAHKRQLIVEVGEKIEENLPKSNPLNPLQIKVIRRIEIEGKPLLEADQYWWHFMRWEAPEVWQLVQNGREQEYELFHGLFQKRFALHRAKGLPIEKEEKAYEELDRYISAHLLVLPGQYYKEEIEPVINKMMEYFGKQLTPF